MVTKSQLIEFILEYFETVEGEPASKSKLEAFKKSELEEFIQSHNMTEQLETWAAQ